MQIQHLQANKNETIFSLCSKVCKVSHLQDRGYSWSSGKDMLRALHGKDVFAGCKQEGVSDYSKRDLVPFCMLKTSLQSLIDVQTRQLESIRRVSMHCHIELDSFLGQESISCLVALESRNFIALQKLLFAMRDHVGILKAWCTPRLCHSVS